VRRATARSIGRSKPHPRRLQLTVRGHQADPAAGWTRTISAWRPIWLRIATTAAIQDGRFPVQQRPQQTSGVSAREHGGNVAVTQLVDKLKFGVHVEIAQEYPVSR
jgi:hypothetical protein